MWALDVDPAHGALEAWWSSSAGTGSAPASTSAGPAVHRRAPLPALDREGDGTRSREVDGDDRSHHLAARVEAARIVLERRLHLGARGAAPSADLDDAAGLDVARRIEMTRRADALVRSGQADVS